MAILDFYAFGVPYGFSSTSGKEKHKMYLETFYNNLGNEYGRKMVIDKKPDGSVFYTLLVHADRGKNFCDCNGRAGSFFGLSLVLTNQQFKDIQKVWTLLNNVYDKDVTENIIEDKPLIKKYKVRNLDTPQIYNFLENAIQKEFDKGTWTGEIINFQYNENNTTNRQVFRPIQPTLFRQNNGR